MLAQLEKFYSQLRRIYTLGCIGALLDWDQKVTMPPEGGGDRAEQLELMSALSHQAMTDAAFLEVVDSLYEGRAALAPSDFVNVREMKRMLDRARCLPVDFVAHRSKVTTLCYQTWTEARAKDDWQAVAPQLEEIVSLCRQEAELIGYEEHPYDALLQGYEPGGKISQIKPLLERLGTSLAEIIPALREKFRSVPEVRGDYPEDLQSKFNLHLATACGYSLARGRLDPTHHPFQTSLGSRDIRITTHFYRNDYLSSVYSTLHEAGHALYEAGTLEKYKGTPMGMPVSLGIHESQSRLWENLIGRSKQFCRFMHATLKDYFPEEHRRITPEELWRMANKVTPSLIRIEADEVTYSLHVVIRLLLEEQLMTGKLAVKDLPDAWNNLYQKYLGIRPTDYKDGVMQDMHWYSGAIGYFPTYALGNLYGAMMLKVAERELPTLWSDVEQGKCTALLAWLRKNVHEPGMTYGGPELIKRISGQDLNEGPFLDYIKHKFAEI
ncbi:MAG: carboxypeptidase M32 [Deltaproteobacteria bacterium]|nr:carboxypeptidase M32 [Deltaproteobacteria bacterium]